MTNPIGYNDPGPERTRLNFAHAVTRKFAFFDDFGFSQVEASPTIVRYRKGDIEATLYHGRKSYELDFEIGCAGVNYSMAELIRAADAEAAKEYRDFVATTQKALDDGLAQLEQLIKRYARRALLGDSDFFIALENQRKAWAETYSLDVLESQLRPKAESAFRDGNYREAADLFERIHSRLTPAEKMKLAIAKGRASN